MKNKSTDNGFRCGTLFIPLIFILISCASEMTIRQADYSNDIYSKGDLKRKGLGIDKVYVQRSAAADSSAAGSKGAVGKGLPFIFDEPLPDFVEKSVKAMIEEEFPKEKQFPISINIDTFRIFKSVEDYGETINLKCNLNFIFHIKADSTEIIPTSVNEKLDLFSNQNDVVENMIYIGLHNCTSRFIDYYDRKFTIEGRPDTELKAMRSDYKDEYYYKEEEDEESEEKYVFSIAGYKGYLISSGFEADFIINFYNKGHQFISG